MLDPRSLASRRDEIVESCRRRGLAGAEGAEARVDEAIAAHERTTSLQTELNECNRRRNEHQKAGQRRLSEEEREAHVAEGRRLKDEVARLEAALAEARGRRDQLVASLPNFVHPDVPVGGEEDYRVVREVGERRAFDFEPADHLALAERLDLVDFEGGARVAGQKWYYLKNEAVLLEIALQRFALERVMERGFVPHVTPDVARPEIVQGTGYNPRGEETQIYSLANADLCLVGTAEITLGGLYADALLDDAALPLRLAGLSHCFRTEAGAHGRESRGLYRVHQFTKVEMFAITRPEESEAMHDEIVEIEERIFQDLEIPYRVIDVASGDLGAPAWRKFDLEAWMPGRGTWGEVTSASNTTDFQARRLRIRYRAGEKRNELVHTLNGTAVANSRALVALLENHQRADGSVVVPKALRACVGRDVIGPR